MLLLLFPVLLVLGSLALDMQVPDSPVVALYGKDTILNCTFSGVQTFNLSELTVFWQLSDTQRNVHAYWEQKDQLTDQEERFANRTSLFPSELASGNASLLLRTVRVADEGIYTCFVKVFSYQKKAMYMHVAAPYSKPVVSWEADTHPRPGEVVALTCVAYDGYPEALLLWQDGSGQNLTENVTVSPVANEQGLFTIRSMLTVTLEPSSTFSCQLINPLLGEEGHASVTITAQGLIFPPVALWVTVGLSVCLLVLLVALAAVCFRKIKESCEELRREEQAKELEETKELQETKSGLEEAKELEEVKTG